MFQKKTTIVIGAGASFEVGLPLGSTLKKDIKNLLDFKFDYNRQISGCAEIVGALDLVCSSSPNKHDELNSHIRAGKLISESIVLAPSIDHFIDVHKGNKRVEIAGKLAIAHAILKAERASKLYVPTNNIFNKMNFDAIEPTWYKSFFELITENCQLEGLNERLSSLTLIIFNYDRCVEFFLINALKQYYDITYEDAYQLVSRINIQHPYGYLGPLPAQGGINNSTGVQFGETSNPQLLNKIFPQIKTFTEGTDPSASEILEIRNQISNSQIIVFLGFAYHRLNLDLLQPTYQYNTQTRSKNVFGSTYDISLSNTQLIANDLTRLANVTRDEVNIKPLTCKELFHEYGRSLSLS